MEVQTVTKQEWQNWKRDPVTKYLVFALLNRLEDTKDAIIDGHVGTEDERLIAIGQARNLKDVVDYVISSFQTIEEVQIENA